MNRKRVTIAVPLGLLALLVTVSAGAIYRDYRQRRLNQDLIVSLKAGDVAAEVRLLNAGADANARASGEQPVTFRGVLKDYWERLRTGSGQQVSSHVRAFLLIPIERQYDDLTEHEWRALVVPLLDHGAYINSRTENGGTLLWWATYLHQRPLVRLLIARNANVNIPDHAGTTILMLAASDGDANLVKLTLKAGANVNAKDREGHTAMKWATQISNTEIIRLLKQAGAYE